jgi:[ribosomal protein S18]-alanine N-acetyltransferase
MDRPRAEEHPDPLSGPERDETVIREATREDCDALASLFGSAIGGHQDPQALRSAIDSPANIVLVVTDKTRLTGGIRGQIAGAEAEIHDVAVHPDHRRQGHGRRLVEAFLSMARGRGVEQVFLEVRVSNRAAQEMYTTAGFITVGDRQAYYTDGEAAAVLRCSC